MARAGDEILDDEGYGLIFRQTARETDGALLEMEAFYRPSSELPPLHFHPRQVEHFEVRSGEFHVTRNGETAVYRPGDTFDVPAGVPHAMYNAAAEKGHLLWQTRPALNSEQFFEKTWTMQRDNRSQGRRLTDLLQLAVIFRTYSQEVRLSNRGQRLLLRLLAPAARLLGYRGTP